MNTKATKRILRLASELLKVAKSLFEKGCTKINIDLFVLASKLAKKHNFLVRENL